MSPDAGRFLPAGTRFSADDLIFYADRDRRSLDEALAEADVLVGGPHGAARLPAEIEPFLVPTFTERLQLDFTDVSTSPVTRRWAEVDRGIVYVECPHPRVVRDANRPRPEDLEASLREAFDRVRAAGPGERVDLSGVDAIRPVTFAFLPVLAEPVDDAGWAALMDVLRETGSRGVDVYEQTRDDLRQRMLEAKLRQARDDGRPASFLFLSFHDTMNTTARPDGAIATERVEDARLPQLVALSNRGDANGDPRDEPVTLEPSLLRALADAHRRGFEVDDPSDVELNRPYLGGHEVTTAAAWLAERRADADDAGVTLGAVQAEFLREYLLGPEATSVLQAPGDSWPEIPASHVEAIARSLNASWADSHTHALS